MEIWLDTSIGDHWYSRSGMKSNRIMVQKGLGSLRMIVLYDGTPSHPVNSFNSSDIPSKIRLKKGVVT